MSRMLLIPVLMVLLVGVASPGLATNSPTIELDTAVHFLTPGGDDVVVEQGRYEVGQSSEWLHLSPVGGEKTDAILVEAQLINHHETIEVPTTLSRSEQEDEYVIMLLFPDGTGLEALGSYSGVRSKGVPRLQLRKRAQTADTLRIRPALKQLWPVGLIGLWIHDPAGPQFTKASKSSGKWYWPGNGDLYPKLIHLTWGIVPVLAMDIPKIIAKQGYSFELRLNGVLLQQGPNALSGDFYAYQITNGSDPFACPQGTTCLGTTILKAKWMSVTPPWTVELSYWKKVKISEAGGKTPPKKYKISGVIYPNQTTGQSYFTYGLYPIFQHERCKTCHAMGSKETLVQRHNGIISASIIQDVQGLLGMNLGCGGGCHTRIKEATQPVPGIVFHDSEWKTPRFDMGIDWRGKSADYICQKVTSSLTTEKMLRDHFFHDARIAWAVHSGKIPPPGEGMLSKAPPGDYFKFKKRVEAWIMAGVPCPK